MKDILTLRESTRLDDITLINTVPSTAKMLLEQNLVLNNLNTFNLAGEPLNCELVNQLCEKFNLREINDLYGPSEYTTYATFEKREKNKRESIGRPIDNTSLYLLDEELGLLPIGAPGELYIGGAGLARGYLNQSGLTAERFIPHPFSDEPGARLYRTGDLVRYLPDGCLEFLGRIDDQVKVRGFRIELGEIASVLLGHPEVKDVVVVLNEVEAEKRIVAYVVGIQETGVGADELRNYAESLLPHYMIPSSIMMLSGFPLTPNGKIDKRSLPEPLWSGVVYEAPRGVTEELLASLWVDVLGVDRVGRQDSFFRLGGHSLLATQLISRIESDYSVSLPVSVLFEHQLLSSQAKAIESARDEGLSEVMPMLPVSRSERLPLSFAQQRLWFLQEYMGANAVYNIPLALSLRGPLDVDVLRLSLSSLLSRHEALRTRFEQEDGQAYQVIDEVDLQLEVELALEDAVVQEACEQERRIEFDLSRDRLCRFRLLERVAGEDYVLLVTMHHSVSDGWSMGVFFRELAALYEAFSRGESSPLVALPIQYADYASWQRQWLTGEVLERQLGYWREQLSGLPPLLRLPTDRPRPSRQTYNGSACEVRFSKELSESLKGFSQSNGVTLYMTLLSGFAVLLGRYTGQHDIAVGSPIANRIRKETEGLIGFFVNTLVMRCDLGGEPGFEALVKRVREISLQAYSHQDIPFEMLVDELQPERSSSYSPLFQVSFSLQNAQMETLPLGDVSLSALALSQEDVGEVSRFDLALALQEGEGGLSGAIEYNTDLFDRGTIERMLAHYEHLLDALLLSPQASVWQISFISEAERHQQLVEWNSTRVEVAQGSIHGLFEAQVLRSPDALALVFEGEELSYEELNARSNQLAHYLLSQGVEREERIGLCVERSLEMVIGMLGILKAGCAYVPIDLQCSVFRLSHVIERSGIRYLLTKLGHSEVIYAARNSVNHPVCFHLDDERDWRAASVDNPAVDVQVSTLAAALYSARDPGLAQGVMLEHGSLFSVFGEVDAKSLLSLAQVSFEMLSSKVSGCVISGDDIAPVGVAGELCLDVRARGYAGSERLTAERFIPHPLSDEPGARLYRTGESARYLGGGEVALVSESNADTEHRKMSASRHCAPERLKHYPGLGKVCSRVLLGPGGEPGFVLYVERGELPVDEVGDRLRAYLCQHSREQCLPLTVIELESLPITVQGSVDYAVLPEPLWSGVVYEAPRGVTEELLASLWVDVLGVDRVGRQDSFFRLGGHSLLATQLISRIESDYSVSLPVSVLFEHQLLSSQAKAIESARDEGLSEVMPMLPVSRSERLPLSFAQQRLWFLQEYMGANAVYNIPLALSLRGPLDVDVLRLSLSSLLSRHEALRTRFEQEDGQAYQVIDEVDLQLEVELALEDAVVQEACEQERRIEFDLSRDRLCRFRLLERVAGEDYVLLVTMHHSVSDGWSMGVFFRELAALYEAFSRGESSPLVALPIQYADYASWQRQWLTGEVLERQLGYWREQLSGLPPLLRLPTDRPRPSRQTYNGSACEVRFSKELSESLKGFSQSNGVTLYMTLLSGFAVLLGRYTGQHDIAVGSPIANRIRKETEGLIGFFVNTLVMRCDLGGEPGFEALVKRVREISLQAYSHQDIPFEMLVDELQPERSSSYSPLFQVSFSLQNAQMETLPLGDVSLSALALSQEDVGEVSRFDLALALQEGEGGLSGAIEYNTDLFDRGTIERMLAHYEHLLDALLLSPQASVWQISFISEAERHQQLVEWNSTRVEVAQGSIHGLFEAQVLRSPDALALVFEGEELSYEELNARSNQLAHYLLSQGVEREERIGLCVERSLEMVVGMLGILKAGCAYVPIDPKYPQKRLFNIITDSGISLIISQSFVKNTLKQKAESIVLLKNLQWTLLDELSLTDHEQTNPSFKFLPLSLDLKRVFFESDK